MRATLGAVFIVWMITTPVSADEMSPDWLPPPVRAPIWDLASPEQPVHLSDDFTHLLLIRTSADAAPDPGSPFAGGRLKLSREATFETARWLSNLDAPDARELREIPALSRDWKSGQSLNLPLPIQESLFVFGQCDTTGNIDHTQSKVQSRTGFGWKCSPFSGGELQVRTGSLMKYQDDSLTKPTERSQLSVELQAKIALFGPMQLQYASEALPAFAQADRHTVLQDLKIALPFGANREFSFGAKYRWEDSVTATPWMQRAELYLGLKFQR